MEITSSIKRFFISYDPANFYLIYSLKATFAFSLNCILGYYFFGFNGAIFAINATTGIFFLSNLEANERKKIEFIILYIILSILFIPFVKPLVSLGKWLALVTFFWIFLVGVSSLYSENLNKILLIVNGTGLAGLIMQNSSNLDGFAAMYGILLGGTTSILIKFGTFSKYGSFTIKSMRVIINELLNLTNALDSENFEEISTKSTSRIRELKGFFNSDSINLKDERLIKNDSRAIFYLYKLEEIAFLLSSFHTFFTRIDDKELLNAVKSEIQHNITELLNLFKGKEAIFKTSVLTSLQHSEHNVFASSISMLYDRLNIIKDSNDDKVELKKPKQTSLKEAIKNINFKDNTTLNSLRLGVCVAIAIYITQASQINHGIWIAIAIMSLSRNNRYMLKTAGKQNIIGGIIGFLLGLGVVILFGNIQTIFICAVVGIFLVYYLKNYSLLVYSAMLMCQLTIMFYIIKNDFLELMLYRIFDIMFGFALVFAIYMLTLPNNTDELENRIKNILNKLANFIKNDEQNLNFAINQDEILSDLKEYKEIIKQEKNQKWHECYKILTQINLDLINLCTYINHSSKDSCDIALKTDIGLIGSRFEMIGKKLAHLPYYFINSFEDKISSKDDQKLNYMLNIIAKKQNELYSLLSF
ncbi:FUSC family protein [Campylobacter mucosalis]|uniref:FUSC family protein n=1 Tax=Campylobacter mucosalis TaxID=202 RepID=UPI00147032E7|nr:FUSC family protein [Campylobacter mucosalis]